MEVKKMKVMISIPMDGEMESVIKMKMEKLIYQQSIEVMLYMVLF